MFETIASFATNTAVKLPRLGFAGVGWIGRKRMEAVSQNGKAHVAAVFDPALPTANDLPGEIQRFVSFEELIASDLDGIVISTPNALHASQAVAALQAGKAVFCQKPLARDAAETRTIVEAAKKANRRIGVDFSYRHITGMQRIRNLITSGELGKIYAIDLVFHNAYGPDKPWFYNRELSGGGCLLDLGVHLVDLAFWVLGRCEIEEVQSALMTNGDWYRSGQVEDYASAQIKIAGGPVIRLVCSWRAPAGCDAEIGATFFGTNGGARLFNIDHSFYHFGAEHLQKSRQRIALADPDDQWGGRAISDWADKIAVSPEFDSEADEYITTAEAIDRIYGLSA